MGYLDSRASAAVAGWAEAGNAPAPITTGRKNGDAMTVMPALERVDLRRAGHSCDAGFAIPLTKAGVSGERIEVLFPNGGQLTGSPCRIM